MIIRKDTSIRIPVRLIDAAGAGVTGMLPANINDGTTVGNVTAVKSDSSVAAISLTNNVNWFEISATKAPGLYHVLLPSSVTNLAGGFQLAVRANAAEFLTTVVTAQVDEFPTKIDLLKKIESNKWQIHASGGDQYRLVIYDDDGTTPLLRFELRDSNGNLTFTNPFRRTPL